MSAKCSHGRALCAVIANACVVTAGLNGSACALSRRKVMSFSYRARALEHCNRNPQLSCESPSVLRRWLSCSP